MYQRSIEKANEGYQISPETFKCYAEFDQIKSTCGVPAFITTLLISFLVMFIFIISFLLLCFILTNIYEVLIDCNDSFFSISTFKELRSQFGTLEPPALPFHID